MKYLTTLTCLVLTISKLQNISAEVNCVKCEDCPEEITDVYESEPCESSCAIYKSGKCMFKVGRFCIHVGNVIFR